MRRFFLGLREAGTRFSRDGCAFLAQSIAFSALFACLPLTILALSVGTLVLPHAQARTLAFFDTLAPALHDYVGANLQTYIYGRSISSVIALVVLMWSGKNLFMALAYALDRALGVPKGRPLVHKLAISIGMLPAVGVLLIVAVALPVLLAIVFRVAGLHDPTHLTHLLAYLVSIALVFLVSVMLYHWLPNRSVPWRFSLRGALLVAATWPVLQYLFTLYATHVDFTRVYGALSAPLVLLLWFYYIGSVFLFGAEYSAVRTTEPGTPA